MKSYFFILVLVSVFASNIFAEQKVLGYRGDILPLQNKSIGSMAIRPDGRYLFFHETSSTSLQVLDLQDFARSKVIYDLPSAILSIGLPDQNTLVAVTTTSVRYFNVAKPFDVTLNDLNFSQTTGSGITNTNACVTDNGKIYLLQSDNRIRQVMGSTAADPVDWTSVYGGSSAYENAILHCTTDSMFIFTRKKSTSSITSDYQFWTSPSAPINTFTLSAEGMSSTSFSYSLRDYILSNNKEQFIMLFERDPSASTKADSIVKVFSVPSFSLTGSKEIGTNSKAITNYYVSDESRIGFFVGVDRFFRDSGGNFLTDKFLSTLMGTLFSDSTFGDINNRGDGLADAGGSIPTVTVSTKADHYKILKTKSSGLTLLSSAPRLQFSGDPSGQFLTNTVPLQFTLSSDVKLTYDIWYTENEDLIDPNLGITTNPGTKILSEQSLSAGVSTATSVSVANLNIVKKGNHSLVIMARADEGSLPDGKALPIARLGLRFTYKPPPDKITDFNLGFGDQSVSAGFPLPSGGNITTLKIFIAQNAGDAASITTARTIQTVNGSISSPIEVAGSGWSGSYVVSPLQNEQTVYMAVQAIDDIGQAGELSEVKSISPHATLTLAQAFGSTASCALGAASPNEGLGHLLILITLVIFILVMLRRSKKLGPAHLRNRRGGD